MKRRKKAFTLIEVIVATGLFAVIFITAGGTFYSALQGWTRQKNTIEVIQDTRCALDFMANEIRHAVQIVKDKPKANGKPDGKLWFLLDTDGDGDGDTTVRYQATGEMLRRGQKAGKHKVAGGDPGWGFSQVGAYIVPGGGFKPFVRTEDDLITITVTIRPHPQQPEGMFNRNITLQTSVRFRNYNGEYE